MRPVAWHHASPFVGKWANPDSARSLDMKDAARKSDLNRYARNDLSHEARAKMVVRP